MFSSWPTLFLLSLFSFNQCTESAKSTPRGDAQFIGKGKTSDTDRKNGFNLNRANFDAHEYIRELYEKSVHDEDAKSEQSVQETDIVYSYIGDGNTSSQIIHFNLSNGHAAQSILRAEIRLKLPIAYPVKRPSNSQSHVLILFDVTNQRPVSRVVIHKGTQQWAVFRVKSLVKRWLSFPQTNHGVRLMVKNRRTGRLQSIKGMGGVEPDENLPQLLIFANQKPSHLNELPFRSLPRIRRNSPNQINRSSINQDKTDQCARRHLYLDLTDINVFGNTIIAPDGFDAYTCEGLCTEPDPRNRTISDVRATLFGSTVRDSTQSRSSDLSCVPSSFSTLSVLWFNGNDVWLLHIPDMIVKECQCSYNKQAAQTQTTI